MILVYKLDRFSRDVYDSTIHEYNLKKYEDKKQSIIDTHMSVSPTDSFDVEIIRKEILNHLRFNDKLIKKNDIYINKRMSAALKYLYPSPSSNDELLDKLEEICMLLDEAISEEEDDTSKSIITFLNYYAHIINNTNITYATCAKDKLLSIISSHKYNWLDQIDDIAYLDISDLTSAYNIIEEKIDEIYSRLNLTISTDCNNEDLLIEKDTDYCNELANVPNNFLSVRKISVKYKYKS